MYDYENRVTARECGVLIYPYDETLAQPYSWICKGQAHPYEWTIEDARCREIIRERFEIATYVTGDSFQWQAQATIGNLASGKTIAEAEIACIKAICEGLDNEQ